MLYSQSEHMLGSLVSEPLLGSSLCLEYHFTFLFIWLRPPHYSDLDQNVTDSGQLSLALQTFRPPCFMLLHLPGHLCSALQSMRAHRDRICMLFFFFFFLMWNTMHLSVTLAQGPCQSSLYCSILVYMLRK